MPRFPHKQRGFSPSPVLSRFIPCFSNTLSPYKGPIITTFFYPAGVPFQFSEFYTYIKERGYVLYPGKLTDADTFRVGNIGEIYPEDIEKLASIIAGFLAAHKEEIA